MFLDNSDNLRNDGSSTANNCAYPISYLRISGSSLELNKAQAKSRFLGVAMDDKDGVSGGADQKLSIATSGQFTYDLKPAKTVHVGNYFGPSGTTSASDMFNQKIAQTTNSDVAMGYFSENKTHAAEAIVTIRTAFGPGGPV